MRSCAILYEKTVGSICAQIPTPLRLIIEAALARAVDGIVRLTRAPRGKAGTLVVLSPFGLGDILITLPGLIKAEEVLGEKVSICCAVRSPMFEILGKRFACISPETGNAASNPFSRLSLGLELRRKGYRYAIRLQATQRVLDSDSLLLLTGAEKTMTLAGGGKSKRNRLPFSQSSVDASIDVVAPLLQRKKTWRPLQMAEFPGIRIIPHRVERMYHALSLLSGQRIQPQPYTYSPQADNPLAGIGAYVVLNAGGAGRKKWPLPNLESLAGKLACDNMRIVVAGGRSEEDAIERLAACLAEKEIEAYALTPATCPDLEALLSAVKCARCVVTPDTFLFHAAVMLATPCLCLYELSSETFGTVGPFVPYPPHLTTERVAYLCFDTAQEYHEVSQANVGRVVRAMQTLLDPSSTSAS